MQRPVRKFDGSATFLAGDASHHGIESVFGIALIARSRLAADSEHQIAAIDLRCVVDNLAGHHRQRQQTCTMVFGSGTGNVPQRVVSIQFRPAHGADFDQTLAGEQKQFDDVTTGKEADLRPIGRTKSWVLWGCVTGAKRFRKPLCPAELRDHLDIACEFFSARGFSSDFAPLRKPFAAPMYGKTMASSSKRESPFPASRRSDARSVLAVLHSSAEVLLKAHHLHDFHRCHAACLGNTPGFPLPLLRIGQ